MATVSRPHLDNETFIKLWRESTSMKEFLAKSGIQPATAANRRKTLADKYEVYLPSFPRAQRVGISSEEIKRIQALAASLGCKVGTEARPAPPAAA